ncbi:hypothetical protein [Sphingopyxis macrogoltabida]|nr:hypothetical protein [Sphingopyxis macrogoltabida]
MVNSGSIPMTEKGAARGVATLDNSGKVPSSQMGMPSAVEQALAAVNGRIDTIQLTPGPRGDSGQKGDKGDAGILGATGPAAATFIGNVTITETLLVSLSLGMKRVTKALAGVALSDKLIAVPNGAPSAGCEVINAYPSSAGNVSIGYFVPALGIGATYSIPVSIYRMN